MQFTDRVGRRWLRDYNGDLVDLGRAAGESAPAWFDDGKVDGLGYAFNFDEDGDDT